MFLRAVKAFLFLFVVAVLARAQQDTANALAVTNDVTARAVEISPDSSAVAGKDFSMKKAYADVFKILATDNRCSNFYGGPAAATTVLNRLVSSVEPGDLPELVSFRMTGRPRLMREPVSGVFYRIFDKAIVNSEGAFYHRRFDPLQSRPRNVGSFAPGTRAARALILMHELGHLIQGRDGVWLIRDDGSNTWQSKENTAQVEQNCRAQLKALN